MKPFLLALAAVLALPALTRADVPPPPDFVETCTVEKQAAPGRTCRTCSSYFRNPADHCAKEVGAGFAHVCRSYGASVWTEVWCRSDGAPSLDGGVDSGSVACDAPSSGENEDEDGEALPLLAREADGVSAESGGCSTLTTTPSCSGLVVLAGWLALRLRRRSAR